MRWYSPEKCTRYPHLGRIETDVFNSFLDANNLNITRMSFDIPVGKTSIPPPGSPENLIRNWNYLCAYKIDVLLVLGNEAVICEVKPRANPSTIGQLDIYSLLFFEEYKEYTKYRKLCICNSCPPLLSSFFQLHNIELHENFHSPYNSGNLPNPVGNLSP